MDYSLEIQENILFLNIKGDLLGDTADKEIQESIKAKVEAHHLLLCGIDLSGVRYMNSSGISLLINLLNSFKENGGEAMLVSPSPQIRKLLEMMKLHTVFSIVDTKEESINQLRKIII
ncbi:MAG: STAS domain-containing protein [Opitutaceae bacterium]|nr:STAS domain-containing protein [Cytophagales bacterium]